MTVASKIEFTPQQAAAIGSRNTSVGLSAGAGCGKTFVLSQRFLRELSPAEDASPPEIEELIAITFTDAAARELRERIRRECAKQLEAAEPTTALYWKRLARSLDSARISTIHSFCGGVLRRYAFDLGLDPGFTVLQAAATRSLENAALAELLRELLAEGDEATEQIVTAWGVDGAWERVRMLRPSARRAEFAGWLSKSPAAIVTAWRQHYDTVFVPGIITAVYDTGIAATMIAALDGITTRSAAEFAHVERLIDLLQTRPTIDGAAAHLEAILAMAVTNKGPTHHGRFPDPAMKAAFTTARSEVKDVAEKLQDIDWSSPEVLLAAELGQALLDVTFKFDARFRREKLSRNALDFDDLLAEAHRLATDPQFAGQVRELRHGVRLLMVDEFQDTDAEQVAIVRGLLGDDLTLGTLFFVGDSKQSIYRFRGAEPRVFDRLRSELPVDGRLPLTENFRSQPAIIEFVNALCCDAFASYEPLAARRPQTTPQPAIEFLWALPAEKQNLNEWRVAAQRKHEARTIAGRLRQLLDERSEIVGCRVSDAHPAGHRPVEQRDIALLFRTLGDVRYYEEALREVGIDYYLVGGKAFYAQQEVFDVLHLLRAVASEIDEVSLLGVLRSPWFGLADETILGLSLAAGSLARGLFGRYTPAGASADELAKRRLAADVISELRGQKDSLPPAELLELAIARTAYDAATVAEFLGERKLANLEKLVEMARAAASAGMGTLDDFVAQLDDYTKDPPAEPPASTSSSSDDVVRLMTVHQSKGLEFPVVVVADAGHQSQDRGARATFDNQLGAVIQLGAENGDAKQNVAAIMLRAREAPEELAESHRQLYVAVTRAADYLIISSALKKLDAPTGPWLKLLAERYDLTSGTCVAIGAVHPALVSLVRESHRSSAPTGPRNQLAKSLAFAKRAAEPVPNLIAAIDVDRAARTQFSVTRLSGQIVADRTWRPSAALANREDIADAVDPLGLGTLVHAVLERLDLARPELIDQLVEHWSTRLAPYHDIAHADAAAAESIELVQNFCRMPLAREVAASTEARREVEFLVPWGNRWNGPSAKPLMLRGYIDLLYRDGAWDWWIVDYKTNHLEPGEVASVAAEYELQMHLYALVVERLLGTPPRGMKLAFVRIGEVFTFGWDAQARERAVSLVDQALAAALSDNSSPARAE